MSSFKRGKRDVLRKEILVDIVKRQEKYLRYYPKITFPAFKMLGTLEQAYINLQPQK
jgi:hypothetical protein